MIKLLTIIEDVSREIHAFPKSRMLAHNFVYNSIDKKNERNERLPEHVKISLVVEAMFHEGTHQKTVRTPANVGFIQRFYIINFTYILSSCFVS